MSHQLPVPASEQRSWVARHRILTGVIVVVLLLWGIGALNDEDDTAEGASDQAAQGADAHPPAQEGAAVDGEPSQAAPTPSREPTPTPTQQSDPATHVVALVIDGDTVELANGETVRLVGIDAPERGRCGYKAATNRMKQMVLGKRVTLRESDEDRDVHGRLLRYVDVNGSDAGMRLIKAGLAAARYDSRDGYGRHPREDRYVAADEASKGFTCPTPEPEPKPKPEPAPTPDRRPVAPRGDCAPGYSPCVPPYPPDVNCPDVGGPITVTGDDPHGLDRDGDGIACE